MSQRKSNSIHSLPGNEEDENNQGDVNAARAGQHNDNNVRNKQHEEKKKRKKDKFVLKIEQMTLQNIVIRKMNNKIALYVLLSFRLDTAFHRSEYAYSIRTLYG